MTEHNSLAYLQNNTGQGEPAPSNKPLTQVGSDCELDRQVIAERATLAVMAEQLAGSVFGINRPEILCARAIKAALDLLVMSGKENRPEQIEFASNALKRMSQAGTDKSP